MKTIMKKSIKNNIIIFLQVLLVVLGITVLTFMLWEPHFEGRNVNSTVFEVYFKDPFLAYAYIASISFFVALYQAFKALGFTREDKTFSQETLKAVRTIKYCMWTLLTLILGAEAYLFIFQRSKDDITGGVFMGLILIAISGTIAIVATKFENKIYGNNN